MGLLFDSHDYSAEGSFAHLPDYKKMIHSPCRFGHILNDIYAVSMELHIREKRWYFFYVIVIWVFASIKPSFLENGRFYLCLDALDMILIGWASIGFKLEIVDFVPTFYFFWYFEMDFRWLIGSFGAILILAILFGYFFPESSYLQIATNFSGFLLYVRQ